MLAIHNPPLVNDFVVIVGGMLWKRNMEVNIGGHDIKMMCIVMIYGGVLLVCNTGIY